MFCTAQFFKLLTHLSESDPRAVLLPRPMKLPRLIHSAPASMANPSAPLVAGCQVPLQTRITA